MVSEKGYIKKKKETATLKPRAAIKNRAQSPEPTLPTSPMPSPRCGAKPIGMWNLSSQEKHKNLGEDEWNKILKSCNAPIGFTHNDLGLYPK